MEHGKENFSFHILEFVHIENILDRENYYLDKLNSEYNILEYAKTMLGFNHSEKIIKKLKLRYTKTKKMRIEIFKRFSRPIKVIFNETNQILGEYSSIMVVLKVNDGSVVSYRFCLKKNIFFRLCNFRFEDFYFLKKKEKTINLCVN